jgi:hypothetical protein
MATPQTHIIHLNGSDIWFDLSDTTRVAHSMYAVSETSYILHITKDVAQATVNTGIIAPTLPAKTLCSKTFTAGAAWEISQDSGTARVCKTCSAKAAK